MMSPTNPCGCFNIVEPALEPPDSWPFFSTLEPYEDEYDRGEERLSGRVDRH